MLFTKGKGQTDEQHGQAERPRPVPGRSGQLPLQAAGHAVAMGNANDYVKSLAHRITADNDHDGVALAVWDVLKEG